MIATREPEARKWDLLFANWSPRDFHEVQAGGSCLGAVCKSIFLSSKFWPWACSTYLRALYTSALYTTASRQHEFGCMPGIDGWG